MRLDENKQLFRQAISAASNHFKIEPSIVEKDYYITIFLEQLSKRIPTLLFKGDTSLSKCHKITERVLYEKLPYNDAVTGIRTLIERGLPS